MPSAFHEYPRTESLNKALIWVGGGICVLCIGGVIGLPFLNVGALMFAFSTYLPLVGVALLAIGLWRKKRPLLTIQYDQLILMPTMFKHRYIDMQPVVKIEREGNTLLLHTKMGNKLPVDLNILHAYQRELAEEQIMLRFKALRQAEEEAGDPKRTYLDID